MPWKPLPFEVPVIFTSSPGAKIWTVTSAPGAGASPTSSKLLSTWGAAAGPSSLKTRVMPSLRPMSPLVIGSPDLDLDIHPGGQVELGQRVHRLGPRVVDVHQALVGPELELLPALLVDMRAPEHRPPLGLDRQRDRSRDLRPGLLHRAHDVGGRLVEDDVVKCLQSNPDLTSHRFLLSQEVASSEKRGGNGVSLLATSSSLPPTSRSSSPRPRRRSARPPGSRTAVPRPSRSA